MGTGEGGRVWANVTVLGDTVVAIALCLPLWRRRPDLVWAVAIAAVPATACVILLKPWMDVPRPYAILGDSIHVVGKVLRERSFPSGHAATACVLAGVVALAAASRSLTALTAVLAVAVAVSRSVVGAHWPSDVFGGLSVGWLSAVIGVAAARRTQAVGMRVGVQNAMGAAMAVCAAALLIGYNSGYPEAMAFQRGIGAAALLSAAWAWRRSRGPT